MTPLTVVVPVPVPELVIVPLFPVGEVAETVMLFVLFAPKIRFPEPVMAPAPMIVGMVVLVLLELIVSVPPPRVIAPLTVNGEVLLFAFIVVTAPVPAVTGALISTLPCPCRNS